MVSSVIKKLNVDCDSSYRDYNCYTTRDWHVRSRDIWCEANIAHGEINIGHEFKDMTRYLIILNALRGAPASRFGRAYEFKPEPIPAAFFNQLFKFIETFPKEDPKKDSLPPILNYIQETINGAAELLTYTENWDEEGATSTDNETLTSALSFLRNYTVSIYGKYAALIHKPAINIMRDGGIYLFWETTRGKLLIIFTKGKSDMAFFYGESKGEKGNIPFKGGAELQKNPQEHIVQWMKDYLTQ